MAFSLHNFYAVPQKQREAKREQERLIREQKEREEQAKRDYNNFFKDSRGYE